MNGLLRVLALASVGSVAFPAYAGTFTIIDVPNSVSTYPGRLNATGWLVGTWYDSTNTGHSFLRDPSGTITTIDPPGSVGSGGPDINVNGVIVGTAQFPDGSHPGFIRNPDGTFTTFEVPGTNNALVRAINGSGTITGAFCLIVSGDCLFAGKNRGSFVRYTTGTTNAFRYGSGSSTDAQGINEGGMIAGILHTNNGNPQGFVRSRYGAATIVFDVPGSRKTFAWAINNTGVIAGSYVDAQGSHGFLRDPQGAFTTFDAPGSVHTSAYGMNQRGAVVGSYSDAKQFAHGYVRWANGSFTTLDVPGSSSTFAADISPANVVIGYFTCWPRNQCNKPAGFIWIP